MRVASGPAQPVRTVTGAASSTPRPTAGGVLIPSAVAPGVDFVRDGPILFRRPGGAGTATFVAGDATLVGLIDGEEPPSISVASADGKWILSHGAQADPLTVHYRTGGTRWEDVVVLEAALATATGGAGTTNNYHGHMTTTPDGVTWLALKYGVGTGPFTYAEGVRVYRLHDGDVTVYDEFVWADKFPGLQGPFDFAWAPATQPIAAGMPPRLAITAGALRVAQGVWGGFGFPVELPFTVVKVWSFDAEADVACEQQWINVSRHNEINERGWAVAWNDDGTRLAVFVKVATSGQDVGQPAPPDTDVTSRLVLYDATTGELLSWHNAPAFPTPPYTSAAAWTNLSWSLQEAISFLHWTGRVVVAAGAITFSDGVTVGTEVYLRAWDTDSDVLVPAGGEWLGPLDGSSHVALALLSPTELLAALDDPWFQLVSIDADLDTGDALAFVATEIPELAAAVTASGVTVSFLGGDGIVVVAGAAAQAASSATGQNVRVAR